MSFASTCLLCYDLFSLSLSLDCANLSLGRVCDMNEWGLQRYETHTIVWVQPWLIPCMHCILQALLCCLQALLCHTAARSVSCLFVVLSVPYATKLATYFVNLHHHFYAWYLAALRGRVYLPMAIYKHRARSQSLCQLRQWHSSAVCIIHTPQDRVSGCLWPFLVSLFVGWLARPCHSI